MDAIALENLIAKGRDGDEQALAELFDHFRPRLKRMVELRLDPRLKGRVDASDVLQETFVQAFRDIHKFELREGASFVGWLKAIAENRLMDAIKTFQRKKRGGDFNRVGAADPYRSSIADFVAILEDEADSPSRMVAKDEAIDAMEIAIAGLPEDQRQAVQLRCIKGLSVDQTAKAMNKTASAVRSLVHRAKQALQQSMYRSSIWLTKR